MEPNKLVISIAEYIELLNEQLRFYKAQVIGEVTQVTILAKGHVYFTLKDKEKEAVLECVMWKGQYALFGIRIEVGMEIIASGNANIYPRWGKMSFNAESIELAGEGALKKKYEALKKKLTEEGLFAQERKKAPPQFPRKIGIITSKQGAVIHDFMNNLGRYGFQITFIDSRVEGAEALPDLMKALKTLKTKDLDVIVLMRGGGSLQSLAGFDAESLVREIASSPIPVIAAIGHDKDVPLSALVADVMVSTPTAAANLLTRPWERTLQEVGALSQDILSNYQQSLRSVMQTVEVQRTTIFNRYHHILDTFSHAFSQIPNYLAHISSSLHTLSNKLDNSEKTILRHIEHAIADKVVELQNYSNQAIYSSFMRSLKETQGTIATLERVINVNDPLRQLAFGYTLMKGSNQRLVKSIKGVTIGEQVTIVTHDGTIGSQVTFVREKIDDDTN